MAPEESPDEVLCDMEFMVGAVPLTCQQPRAKQHHHLCPCSGRYSTQFVASSCGTSCCRLSRTCPGALTQIAARMVTKDKLHKLRDGAAGALHAAWEFFALAFQDAVVPGSSEQRNFLLTTFREAVSLWHRLRLAPEAGLEGHSAAICDLPSVFPRLCL